MTGKLINFPEGRGNQPDADCVMRDDKFRQMFMYGYHYELDGGQWSISLWASDQADAEARLKAIRETLTLTGQIMAMVPA